MDLDRALRLHVWRLITKFGMNQKVIAARMEMKPSPFNRWLHGEKKKPGGLNIVAGMRQLLADLAAEETFDVTRMPAAELDRLEMELGASEAVTRGRHREQRRVKTKRPKAGKRLAKGQ